MHLRIWIAAVGDDEAAKFLAITERSARAYRLAERWPRRERAAEIIELTQYHPVGEVRNYNEIYADLSDEEIEAFNELMEAVEQEALAD